MKQLGLDEISFDRTTRRGALPFELSRESCASPVGVRVGFEIANMRDRLGFIDGTKTGQCKVPPGAIAFCPVKRSVPVLFVQSNPAERQPEFRSAVTVILYKRDVFAICDGPCRQRKGGNECLVTGFFVVVRELIAVMAYL